MLIAIPSSQLKPKKRLADHGRTVILFLMKLFKSANMDIINDCLLHALQIFITVRSELIQERKVKFVSKFACCQDLLWQFGIDFI